MCYDISFKIELKQLTDYFPSLVQDEQVQINPDKSIHIIGHEYGEHPVIYRNREDGLLHLKLMEWGCIPFYVKEEQGYLKQRSSMLNARSERVLSDKQSYWHKIRNRRCLVPVSAFYEHREVKVLRNKVPYHIGLDGHPVFFLPGLYSVADLPDMNTGELKQRWTFAILTTTANRLMREIHNSGPNKERMPLILANGQAYKWVSEVLEEQDYQELLQTVFPAEKMEYKTVFSIRGNKPRPDGLPKNEYYKWEGVEDILL